MVKPLIDLGTAPPSNAYLTKRMLNQPERWFPLRVLICEQCWLVQTEDFAQADELFDENYAYFSSFSDEWVHGAEIFVEDVRRRFRLDAASFVVEVAANDGYMLQFVKQAGIPCLGIEPTASTAAAALQKGIEIVQEFFGLKLARHLLTQFSPADLMVAKNVLAHVPDINDFVLGFAHFLKIDGVATFEFPHMYHLIKQKQFDTIYHEHFSYLSLTSVVSLFADNGLRVFDVEELPSHGGSLRVFAQRSDSGTRDVLPSVAKLLQIEREASMSSPSFYFGFQESAEAIKNNFKEFLITAHRSGKKVAGYGAAAKGNTLLNFAGVRSDLVSFVADRNPSKQGKFMPGSRIPIFPESQIVKMKPDYVVILPWNLKSEIMGQLSYIREWGGKFVTATPKLGID